MRTEWKEEQSSVQPAPYAQLNPDTYIQRRNIRRAEPVEEGIDPGWACDCRLISADVYAEAVEQEDMVQRIVLETTGADKYKDGYDAARILLGGDDL